MSVPDNRPYFLNLVKIRLPLPGIISIFHRISGVVLFLAIPFAVYLLDLSLQNDQGFRDAAELLQQPLIKLLLLVLAWSIIHHFYAGIRFLLIDFDIGVHKAASRIGAMLVIAAELLTLGILLVSVYP